MKKNLYIVEDLRKDSDSFQSYFWNVDEALKEARYLLSHLTKREIEKTEEFYVVGYEVEVPERYATSKAQEFADDFYSFEIEEALEGAADGNGGRYFTHQIFFENLI